MTQPEEPSPSQKAEALIAEIEGPWRTAQAIDSEIISEADRLLKGISDEIRRLHAEWLPQIEALNERLSGDGR